MIVSVGLEYGETGFIESAIWWKGDRRPDGVPKKYHVVDTCLVRRALDGEELYGVALDKRSSCFAHDWIKPNTLCEVLGENLFRHEAEAANSAVKIPPAKWRTIKILYYDTAVTNNLKSLKNQANLLMEAYPDFESKYVTRCDILLLEDYKSKLEFIYNKIKDDLRVRYDPNLGSFMETVINDMDKTIEKIKGQHIILPL